MLSGLVAIVGRPNVGKSTLYNLLTRSKTAIVDDQPGVTRDRLYGEVFYDKKKTSGFMLIDTGGFETDDFNFQPFTDNIVWQQTVAAIEEADIVILLLDAKAGLHQHDRELVQFLKVKDKKVVYAVNKVDGDHASDEVWEFYGLGIEEIHSISAAHNRGIRSLMNHLKTELASLDSLAQKDHDPDATKIALIGRPNAGKSSLLNRLCGEERAVVSEVAGTTRDSIDTRLKYHGKSSGD